MRQVILTGQFSRHFRHGAPNGYLQWCNIKCCHVILATTLIIIINDVLTHIIIWSWVFDVCFTPTVVYNKHQYQDCKKEKKEVMNTTAINLLETRSEWVSEIWGSHDGDYKGCYVLGYDAVGPGKSVWTLQRTVLPSALGYIIMMVKAAGTFEILVHLHQTT